MQNLLKLRLVSRCRDSLRKTERLILEEGTGRILEAWTMFLWEMAEDLNAMEGTMTEVKDRLEKKEKGLDMKKAEDVRMMEVVQRFNHIFRKKQSKKAILAKENESLLEEIDRQKELIRQLEEALKEANSKLVSEIEKSFEEGVKIGRNIAEVEELGVLEELEILKEIQSMLEGNADNCKPSHHLHSKLPNILL